MTLHNIATVITPNIFRPFDFTPNDLIYAGHLVEVLKLMMQHYREIFEVDEWAFKAYWILKKEELFPVYGYYI